VGRRRYRELFVPSRRLRIPERALKDLPAVQDGSLLVPARDRPGSTPPVWLYILQGREAGDGL
jgi:hypothetical protein